MALQPRETRATRQSWRGFAVRKLAWRFHRSAMGFFSAFCLFFFPQMVFIAGKAAALQAQFGWESLKTEKKRMWGGRFQTCPSSGRAGVACYHFLLAQSTRLLCSPAACSEPEVPVPEWAHQLSQLRQNSLVQRLVREARAPSTIPSTIPTDWETLEKKKSDFFHLFTTKKGKKKEP